MKIKYTKRESTDGKSRERKRENKKIVPKLDRTRRDEATYNTEQKKKRTRTNIN